MRGLPRVELLFQAAGGIGQVAPELCGQARRWRSLTPYLRVRHAAIVPARVAVAGTAAIEALKDAVDLLAAQDALAEREADGRRTYRLAEVDAELSEG